jgi:hypothetical protein
MRAKAGALDGLTADLKQIEEEYAHVKRELGAWIAA